MLCFFIGNEKGKDVNDVVNGQTLLQNGCDSGNVALIQFLMKQKDKIDCNVMYTKTDETVLHLASKHDKVDIFKMILNVFNFDFKRLINHFSNEKLDCISAFLRLCHMGNLKCLKYLLQYSRDHYHRMINILATDMYGRNALHLAIHRAMLDEKKGISTVKFLLENVYFANSKNINDVLCKCSDSQRFSILNGKDCAGSTPLHYACAFENQHVGVKILRMLLKYNCDINTFDDVQKIPKHYSQCLNYFQRRMEPFILHENGGDYDNIGDISQRQLQVTPLMVAILKSNFQCVDVLCNQPDVAIVVNSIGDIDCNERKTDVVDRNNYCTFELACHQGSILVFEQLLFAFTKQAYNGQEIATVGSKSSQFNAHYFNLLNKRYATFDTELILSLINCVDQNKSLKRWEKRNLKTVLGVGLRQLNNEENIIIRSETIKWHRKKELLFDQCTKCHNNLKDLRININASTNGSQRRCSTCTIQINDNMNAWAHACLNCHLFVCDHCCMAIELKHLVKDPTGFESLDKLFTAVDHGCMRNVNANTAINNRYRKLAVIKRVKSRATFLIFLYS